jgi:hypothetical protein
MDSLDGINTVSDLVSIQKGRPDTTDQKVEDLVTPIFQESPALGLKVVKTLLSGLYELHDTMIEEMVSRKEPVDKIEAWIEDRYAISKVIDTLNEIEI